MVTPELLAGAHQPSNSNSRERADQELPSYVEHMSKSHLPFQDIADSVWEDADEMDHDHITSNASDFELIGQGQVCMGNCKHVI